MTLIWLLISISVDETGWPVFTSDFSQSHSVMAGTSISKPTFELQNHTPMMQQYLSIKADYPVELLFYRMGDFYECFYDDAVRISALLNLTLTKRQDKIPMAGVPVNSLETTLERLINKKQTIHKNFNIVRVSTNP